MNKKLILAAMAVILAAGSAQATNVTGATGSNGVYSVKPEKFSGIAGYRKYDNFTVTKGDRLNLEFVRPGTGKTQPTAFVNLVGSNGVNINGIVNTTRDGLFYNAGHAIFITPGGFVVGESGVLNVGRLSVATPTATKYNDLVSQYNKDNVYAIGQQISQLTQNSKGNAGAANITINGRVFTRSGAEMTGKTVSVPGSVVNGVKEAKLITTTTAADTLFNSLVNTNGLMKETGGQGEDLVVNFVSNGSRILIKSTNSLAVSGSVLNGAGNVYVTNNGASGLKLSGVVDADNTARIFNTKGNLILDSNAKANSNIATIVQNKGTNLTLGKNSTVGSIRNVEVINQGSGRLTASGRIASEGDPSTYPTGRHLSVLNKTGSGMTVEGYVVMADGKGDIALHNYKGDMIVNGHVTNENGNIGIINQGTGATMSKNAVITNTGKLKIANTGSNGLTIVGDIKNNGETRIYNDGGKLSFTTDSTGAKAAQIINQNGKLYIASRKNATGVSQSTKSNIENTNGNLVIRNSGTKVASGERGLDLQGGIKATNGTLSINNDMGDMYVSSNTVVSKGNLGIINRANGKEMTLARAGKVNVTDGNVNIKNYGTGDMTVNSTITHNGRVNVLANKGALNLGSTVHNNSGALGENGGFYAAARKNGTGVNVTNTFAADGKGEVLIKNIIGSNGLKYAGTIDVSNNQAALVNKKGDMNISGSITTHYAPVIISNQGRKLTITDSAYIKSCTQGNLFDAGTEAASISSKASINNMVGHGNLKGKI